MFLHGVGLEVLAQGQDLCAYVGQGLRCLLGRGNKAYVLTQVVQGQG